MPSYITYYQWYIYIYISAVSRENQQCGLCVKYRPDQPKHAAQAYTDRHFSPPVDFILCVRSNYSIPLSPWDRMCRSRLACAESIMLVLSWDCSYLYIVLYIKRKIPQMYIQVLPTTSRRLWKYLRNTNGNLLIE